jgi:hypothetical protein
MRMTTAITAAAAFGLGGLVGALALLASIRTEDDGAAAGPPRPVWTEVQWPFLMDEWGRGKAFQCKAADCGTEVNLYLRAKLGFCNCTSGVADDEELERLSDFSLVGDQLSAASAGRPITVAWMNGRSRAYAIVGSNRSRKSALAVAFNDRCDAIVATVVLGHDRPAMIEPGVIEFLNGSTVLRWAELTLGL